MYKIITTVLALSISFLSIAQNADNNEEISTSFSKGDLDLSIGYGAPYISTAKMRITEDWLNDNGLYGIGTAHADIEYGLSDKVGLVLSANYASFGLKYEDNEINGNAEYNYKTHIAFKTLAFIPRLNFHFIKNEKVDVYWGFGFGYKIWKANIELKSSYKDLQSGIESRESYSEEYSQQELMETDEGVFYFNPIGFETTVGLKYYFTPNIGLYAEAGFAKSIFQAGLAFKL